MTAANTHSSSKGIAAPDFLMKNIQVLKKVENKNILSGLGELLTEKQKIWVKAKLKDETLFSLRLALDMEERERKIIF